MDLKNNDYELHKKIKMLRLQEGYTQKYVADFMGVDVTTYSKYENAQRTPNVQKLRRLAELYGMRDELLCSKLPMETFVIYTKKELDDFQNILENCHPEKAKGYLELKSMYDRLHEAFEPIWRRQMEACDFPDILSEKLLARLSFKNDKTVKRVYLNPRAEALTAIYLKKQDEIIDKMMGR